MMPTIWVAPPIKYGTDALPSVKRSPARVFIDPAKGYPDGISADFEKEYPTEFPKETKPALDPDRFWKATQAAAKGR